MDSKNLLRHVIEKATPAELDRLVQNVEFQVRGTWGRFVDGRLEAENGAAIGGEMGEVTALRVYEPADRPMIVDGKPLAEALKTDLTPKA